MKIEVMSYDTIKNEVILKDEYETEGNFFLGPDVKSQYIKLGPAEITLKDDVVTYIKMDQPAKGLTKPKTGFGTGKPEEVEKIEDKDKKFYKTKHLVLENLTADELREGLNLASDQHWVIATQTHFVDGKWSAVIYFKEPPQENAD